MPSLEQRIKDFAREQGVAVVGVAGPERLLGPPSLDPTYTMAGARSIVSLALPMDVPAIYDFLGKKSPVSHNLDQLRTNQRVHRICHSLAEHLRSLGCRAQEVPPNNTYRRSLDMLSLHPSFSHRFGAIAAGIGAQGWSGNIMTEEYGAAVYLGTVVTEAVLASDPALSPRYFVDNYCTKCKLCEKVCASGMFVAEEEEQVLLNGELHPRGKRRNLDLCNFSCFGLHALSRDQKWTTWGRHWIPEWIGDRQDPRQKNKIRAAALRAGSRTGDSAPRYDLIRNAGSILFPQEALESQVPQVKDLPEDELERNAILKNLIEKNVGIRGLRDPNALTCGQCALVCGPNLKETADRFHLLAESGLVVPGPEGRMVRVDSYEAAVAIKKKYPQRVSRQEMRADAKAFGKLWTKLYFGIEPRSILQGWLYARKLKKKVREQSCMDPEPER
jgi:epoxyqueuosine reductase QueG